MPTTTLDTSDAVELAELLQFLHDWLATDPARLGESLNSFAGSPGYDLGELRADLHKFTFLLGATDGEACSPPNPNSRGHGLTDLGVFQKVRGFRSIICLAYGVWWPLRDPYVREWVHHMSQSDGYPAGVGAARSGSVPRHYLGGVRLYADPQVIAYGSNEIALDQVEWGQLLDGPHQIGEFVRLLGNPLGRLVLRHGLWSLVPGPNLG